MQESQMLGGINTHKVSLSLRCQCVTQTKQLFWSVQTTPGHWHVSSLAPAVVNHLHLSLRLNRYLSLFLLFLLYTYSVRNTRVSGALNWTWLQQKNLDGCKKWRMTCVRSRCMALFREHLPPSCGCFTLTGLKMISGAFRGLLERDCRPNQSVTTVRTACSHKGR